MKGLKKYLSPVSQLKKSLYKEVQNDTNGHATYHTLDISDAMNKFKYGFIDINTDDGYICLISFDSAKDFEDLMGVEEGTFDELETVSVKASTLIDDGSSTGIYRRIW